MRIHLIIDFMYLYYKYKCTLENGRLKRLIIDKQGLTGGIDEGLDVSLIYYPIKEIEGIRNKLEEQGNDVVVSICFDAPTTERKEKDREYKSNRNKNRLSELDFGNIQLIRGVLGEVEYNVYFENAEADDLVYNLNRLYSKNFDKTIIYTPDTDLLINVNNNTEVYRYKSRVGYTRVTKDNYSEYCSAEYQCSIPYNGILLYKTLCGDTSDKVTGIKGFGRKSFDKYLDSLILNNQVDVKQLDNKEYIKSLLENTQDKFKDGQVEQALHSLDMVAPYIINDLKEPKNKANKETREKAYSKYDMYSLIS